MLRGFLENLRDMHGSQTVFCGGRIDDLRPAEAAGQAKDGLRAVFYWMGNITAHVFTGGQRQTLSDAQDDASRWSTKQGAQGVPAAKVLALGALDRLLLYTDGLSASSEEQTFLNSSDTLISPQDLLTRPAGDDVTVLDLRWHTSSPAAQSSSAKGQPL